MRRVAGVGFAALVAAVLIPSTASGAASLYAAPSGSGSACTQASPCSLPTAISRAAAGDHVYALANQGDYHFSSDVVTDSSAPIHLHGMNGRARLVLSNASEFKVISATAEDFLVIGTAGRTAVAFEDAATADRVVVLGGPGEHACYMRGSTLRNSICAAAGDGDLAIETDGSNVLRNDTLVGGTEAALKAFGRSSECACTSQTVTMVNVISRSGSGGADIKTDTDGSAALIVDTSYSNFATVSKTGGAPGSATVNQDATNQNASPIFVDPATRNYHQAASSPTIDAGVDDAANGVADFEGDTRTVGAATDIGADERILPPNTTITKSTVKPARHKATFTFHATGSATGFQCSLARSVRNAPPAPFAACESPKTFRHLSEGTYRFKVRALGPGGTDPTPARKRFTV